MSMADAEPELSPQDEEDIFETWNELDNADEHASIRSFQQLENLDLLVKEQYKSKTGRRLSQTRVAAPELVLDDSYGGPRFGAEVTLDVVIEMMEYFKQGGTLHPVYARQVLESAKVILAGLETVRSVEIPAGGQLVVVGDTHGQLEDVFTIIHMNGLPSDKTRYVFNGDFVDRGENGVEIMLTLLAFLVWNPDCIALNRGNHEALSMNQTYNFQQEVRDKYNDAMFDLFQEVFCLLPLATLVQQRVIVLHGGLFKQPGVKVAHMQRIRRNCQPPIGRAASLEDSLMEDLLWSDPMPTNGIRPNTARGAGAFFGPDATAAFLAENGLDMIIRSHECRDEGYEVAHNGKLLTIFSASNYCGDTGNKGAFVVFTPDMKAKVKQFTASDIQAIPPPKERIAIMQRNIVSKIVPRICASRIDLMWYWTNCEKEHEHLITAEDWETGMRTVLQLDIKWKIVMRKLVEFEADGRSINWIRFLERFQIDLTGQASSWVGAVIRKVQDRLYEQCRSARDAFSVFDANGDGFISFFEFHSTLRSLDLGLTDQQIYELMRDVDQDMDNRISLDEFMSRFQVMYNRTGSGDQVALDKVQEIGRVLLSAGANEGAMRDAFTKYDTNNDGILSHAEFSAAIRDIGLVLTPDEEGRVLSFVDSDASGGIDFEEFTQAFSVVDTKTTSRWQHNIIQQVHQFLYQNRFQLRRVFSLFDTSNTGSIDAQEFKMGLASLNLLSHQQLSDLEVDELMNALDANKDGRISYAEFLEGFQVVDLIENPEDRVKAAGN
jgi:protein phosphatase|eukprot:TRINITY_DN844_c1_g1_i1.p1 TRINITY_DN844_c1_g1~~TRINITY_DN844_c1_g1_i1.p1  ORF type:complete len:776 (-),score=440.66 TRINITY_DN844_c1_g1_i1:76-2403(-)